MKSRGAGHILGWVVLTPVCPALRDLANHPARAAGAAQTVVCSPGEHPGILGSHADGGAKGLGGA